ncbi:unnamed protein product [Aspergillus oryzae]|uniref:Unnamed protein product n=2 Tax=Aspergillus oryzae TaxID=5062 RepID=A0AAN4YTN3_ASPOZ|nr:unnamed protein product [Aspergillus oryzae]GMF95256.1 unnamed protein product [Aspergillus oryzae]GMG15285.1 unnamed protein product [Aspergillus oryzae]GMG37823.1 unnamed protein product [Aspergillus oryzae]GMG54513.1 unnamed protein product [Aspergillus oryzae var. brunneus]
MADQWGFVKHGLETTVAPSAPSWNRLQLDPVVQPNLDSNLPMPVFSGFSVVSAILPVRNPVSQIWIRLSTLSVNLNQIELDWTTEYTRSREALPPSSRNIHLPFTQ